MGAEHGDFGNRLGVVVILATTRQNARALLVDGSDFYYLGRFGDQCWSVFL